MPKRAIKKNIEKEKKEESNWITEMRLEESYTSLLLGLAVVMLSAFLLVSYIRSKRAHRIPRTAVSSQKTVRISPAASPIPTGQAGESAREKIVGKEYVVKEGDQLWEIAQRAYGDQHRWPDIATANGIVNPDDISTGQKLTIPR